MWETQILNYVPFNEQEEQDKKVFVHCMQSFEDILTRQNIIAHVTCSAFVVNRERTKVLMVHHHIYQSWAWTGGHADGESNLLRVALREVQEETGVVAQAVQEEVFALDVLTVLGHMKKGVYVSPHLHLNVTYLLEADESQPLRIAEEENSAVAWLPIEEIASYSSEPHMIPVYEKIIRKMKQLAL